MSNQTNKRWNKPNTVKKQLNSNKTPLDMQSFHCGFSQYWPSNIWLGNDVYYYYDSVTLLKGWSFRLIGLYPACTHSLGSSCSSSQEAWHKNPWVQACLAPSEQSGLTGNDNEQATGSRSWGESGPQREAGPRVTSKHCQLAARPKHSVPLPQNESKQALKHKLSDRVASLLGLETIITSWLYQGYYYYY